MSFLFAESNEESTKDLFQKRVIYRGLMQTTQDHINIVDFNLAEKYMYGRVNRYFIPMVVNNPKNLKTFRSAISMEKNMQALDFVVDAFEGLAANFRKCAATGKIDINDPFLSNLTIHKAYIPHEKAYKDYMQTYKERIVSQFAKNRITVKNFDEFMIHFMNMVETTSREFPFTKTAFIKSRFCPVTTNGLAIEIAEAKYSNDDKKMKQFVNSNNWDFYVNACKNYGFMIDLLHPWRLVADIAGIPMLEYASRYGLKSRDQIISRRFSGVHNSYFNFFIQELPKIYNEVRKDMYEEIIECEGRIVTRYRKSARYTPQQFARKYPDLHFLKLYMKIRFLEEESKLHEGDKSALISDTEKAFLHLGPESALGLFERILNKTFDYQGSLSYINKEMGLFENEITKKPAIAPDNPGPQNAVGRFGSPGFGRGGLAPDEQIDLS